jgi:hypothetical protein
VQHRRDDAGGAVGRRGDDATAGGVLSFTASAYRFTQSSTVSGSFIAASGREDRSWYMPARGARPSAARQHAAFAGCRAARSPASRARSPAGPARICSSLRQARSFAHISCAIVRLFAFAQLQQLVAAVEGIGTGWCRRRCGRPRLVLVDDEPPPTE